MHVIANRITDRASKLSSYIIIQILTLTLIVGREQEGSFSLRCVFFFKSVQFVLICEYVAVNVHSWAMYTFTAKCAHLPKS